MKKDYNIPSIAGYMGQYVPYQSETLPKLGVGSNPASNLDGYQGYAHLGEYMTPDYLRYSESTSPTHFWHNVPNNSVANLVQGSSLWQQRLAQANQINPNKSVLGEQFKYNWNNMSLGDKANTIVGTVSSILNAYNGYKAGKLAREQFNHAKDMAERNYQAQRKMTNSQLEDRQKRRVLEANSAGRSATSVADYMAKYGV